MNNQKDIMQVFGCLMKQPSLLSQTDKYKFYVDDFQSRFERKIFSSILYLWQHGAESIGEIDIVNYFSNIQSEYDYFEEQNGLEYINDCIELSDLLSFDYYYERVKKFSLLSQLKKVGYNTDKIYSENNLSDSNEEINKEFEQKTIKEIIDELNCELIKISEKCLSEDGNKTSNAAKGASELIEGLKGAPDTGARLQGKFFNTVVRGARRGKFYIRSASSGIGKTRNTIGDACYLSYPICWNNEQNKWDFTGATEKVLIIVTEQEKDEVQTMIISYLSGVNEEKILYGSYNDEESDRIQKALWIMDKYNNLYITEMPNPNVQQIKFVVKEMCRRYDIGYVFYDYLFSNPSLLNEYRDLKIREDQALGIFSAELKALAVETNTFILTSTQTNAKVEDDGKEIKNESVIRGSRAIIDKADIACVCARPSQEDLEHIEPYCSFLKPNIVTDIYKVRRGRFNNVRIWSYIDLGTCRKTDLFVTNTQYELIEVGNLKQQYDEEQSWLIQTDVNQLNEVDCARPPISSASIEYIDQSTGEVVLKEEKVSVTTKKQSKGLFDI